MDAGRWRFVGSVVAAAAREPHQVLHQLLQQRCQCQCQCQRLRVGADLEGVIPHEARLRLVRHAARADQISPRTGQHPTGDGRA